MVQGKVVIRILLALSFIGLALFIYRPASMIGDSLAASTHGQFIDILRQNVGKKIIGNGEQFFAEIQPDYIVIRGNGESDYIPIQKIRSMKIRGDKILFLY